MRTLSRMRAHVKPKHIISRNVYHSLMLSLLTHMRADFKAKHNIRAYLSHCAAWVKSPSIRIWSPTTRTPTTLSSAQTSGDNYFNANGVDDVADINCRSSAPVFVLHMVYTWLMLRGWRCPSYKCRCQALCLCSRRFVWMTTRFILQELLLCKIFYSARSLKLTSFVYRALSAELSCVPSCIASAAEIPNNIQSRLGLSSQLWAWRDQMWWHTHMALPSGLLPRTRTA